MKLKSIMIILSMLLMLIPSPASASVIEGTDGGNLTWTFEQSTGVFTVSGEGDMYNWNTPAEVIWRTYASQIKKVIIGDGVTIISQHSFASCYRLEEITIGNNVRIIGQNAFSSSKFLTSITIPKNVEQIYGGAFANCTALTEVTLQGSDTRMPSSAFLNCTAVTDVYYVGSDDEWNTLNSGLYPTIFPNATIHFECVSDDEGNEDITQNICGDNATWTIDDDGTLTISGDGDIYDYTVYSNAYPSNGQNHAPWAWRYEEINNVVISDGITGIGQNAFSELGQLESITLPQSIERISAGAFVKTTTTDLYINNLETWCRIDFTDSYSNPMLESDNVYINNESLSTLTIPDSITTIKPYTFPLSLSTNISEIIIPDSVTTIDERAFSKCRSIERITIPGSITEIPNFAFSDCNNLQSITIPDSVTTIGNSAFSHCIGMTSITIPNTITSIDEYAFDSCDMLETVYYDGTQAEWNAISVAHGNDCLLNANVIFTNDENTEEPDIPEMPDEPVTPPSGGSGGGSADDIDHPNMLWITDAEASSGDEVTVYVKAGSDVLAALGSFIISYDTNMLTYKYHEFLGELSNLSTAANPNYQNTGKFYANFMNTQNINLEGDILAITFEVGTHVPNNTSVPVMFDKVDFYYETEELSPVGFLNGNIWVLNYILGDVNNNGIIDLLDALRVLRYDAGLLPAFTMSEEKAADANRDDVVNVLDAILIQSHCAKLDIIF